MQKDNFSLAESRYAAGMGGVIELSDAQVTQTRKAAAQEVGARFSLASARATLWGALDGANGKDEEDDYGGIYQILELAKLHNTSPVANSAIGSMWWCLRSGQGCARRRRRQTPHAGGYELVSVRQDMPVTLDGLGIRSPPTRR